MRRLPKRWCFSCTRRVLRLNRDLQRIVKTLEGDISREGQLDKETRVKFDTLNETILVKTYINVSRIFRNSTKVGPVGNSDDTNVREPDCSMYVGMKAFDDRHEEFVWYLLFVVFGAWLATVGSNSIELYSVICRRRRITWGRALFQIALQVDLMICIYTGKSAKCFQTFPLVFNIRSPPGVPSRGCSEIIIFQCVLEVRRCIVFSQMHVKSSWFIENCNTCPKGGGAPCCGCNPS